MPSGEFFGKISAQPHTIVKQICFPNGNVLFFSLFPPSKNWMHNVVWGYAEILPFLLLQLTLFRINCFMSLAANANHSYPTEKISWHYTLLFKSHGEYQKAKEYHQKALLTFDWCLLLFSKIWNRTIEGTTLAQL